MNSKRTPTFRPINLGVIGCGIAARELHLPALLALKDRFTITMVCNHTRTKARSFSRLVGGVPYVLDYKELLANPAVEAVDIVLPIELNFRTAIDSFKAGKHVFMEKPLAANLRDAKRLVALERTVGPVAMIAENYRYQTLVRRVASHLERGVIGKPYAAEWKICAQVTPENKYAQTTWRIHHKYPGGFVTDGGVHHIAALRTIFGELRVVHAFTKCVNPAIGKLDTLSAHFKSGTGVDILFNIFFSAAGHDENRWLIFGTKGTLEVIDNRILVKRPGGVIGRELIKDDGGFKAEFADFFEAVRLHKKPLSTFAEGYKDLKGILEALDAARR